MRLGRVNEVTAIALQKAADTQPWPDQFRRRRAEFELLLSHLKLSRMDRVLEIGCGNAFGSVLLAQDAGLVVATDLVRPEVASHSIGMESPKRLIQRLAVENCVLAAASAERLPFRAEAFDLVFSFYVLEHIPDKARALGEMRRVLKPGGLAIAFVPNYVERIYAPLGLYLYLGGRIVQRLRRTDPGAPGTAGATPTVRSLGGFRRAYPHFPMPEPHGAYRDSWQELKSHRPGKWKRLFRTAGFEIKSTFSIMTLPANLLEPVIGRRVTALYDRLIPMDRLLSRWGVGAYLGQYSCVIACRAG